jgi:hypothetical protein
MSKEIVPTNTYVRDEQATIGGYRDGPPPKIAMIKLNQDKNAQKPNQQSQK